ncbi:MAG TPA: hypothetical protein VGM84_16265, partial [Steroidobacteraceae bacterium]
NSNRVTSTLAPMLSSVVRRRPGTENLTSLRKGIPNLTRVWNFDAWYYLWGRRGHDGRVTILVGGLRKDLLKVYDSVEAMGATDNPWALPLETGRTIWICRGRFRKLDTDWSELKHYR